MFSDDEGAEADTVAAAAFVREFDALTRRSALRPGHLKQRLRELGIAERVISRCTTRSDLLELLLFAKIPRRSNRALARQLFEFVVVVAGAVIVLLFTN